MIAKLIAHAPTRAAAIERITGALDRTLIAGVRTNVAFLGALCRAPAFREGSIDTGFIDRNLGALGAVPHGPDFAAGAFGVVHLFARETPAEALAKKAAAAESPWAARDGFQLGGVRTITVPIVIDGNPADAAVTYGNEGVKVAIDGTPAAVDTKAFDAGEDVYVLRHGRQTRLRLADVAVAGAAAGATDGVVKAPMHGKVLDLFVAIGDAVDGGQRLAVIEAMKMEHTLRAPFAGTVTEVAVAAGVQVVEGGKIMVIQPAAGR